MSMPRRSMLLLCGLTAWLLHAPCAQAQTHDHGAAPSHAAHDAASAGSTGRGWLGSYAMTREASGTSWQPEATPHAGAHWQRGDWTFMAHANKVFTFVNYDGKRGGRDVDGPSMTMAAAQHPLGPGTWGARVMLSLDPLMMGEKGTLLPFQTGETADGRTPLIDRQHPHDFFMELATMYSVPVGDESSLFAYAGLPGEPALGPPAFMHRFSAMDNPEAPLTHHWLDSTHITFGVATVGAIWHAWKIEGSLFRGREPDEDRWDIEAPQFDSYAARVTYNPTPAWSMQVSGGHLDSPEQLEPETDTDRFTASVIYHATWREMLWDTTAAWGRNRQVPGRDLDGLLLESVLKRRRDAVFTRWETVEKNELFNEGNPLHDKAFTVHKATVGYLHDFKPWHSIRWGVGVSGSVHWVPEPLRATYGKTPYGVLLFVRLQL